MPGILPMKMIRVGSTTQSRVAQACDRCRSKKIRCDGIRPCCTQCSNVGFECKTSDKLSRRAFPRGYTESLEDRVRALEAEVRELKDLLDEKDEKIDMLSRIHNFNPSSRKSSSSLSPNTAVQVKDEVVRSAHEEVLHVEIPAPVQLTGTSTGDSTTAALIEAFEGKVQDSGLACPAISIPSLLTPPPIAVKPANTSNLVPPRLQSDQYINCFFQEWQPLLPILHRPTFLKSYSDFLVDPESRLWQNNKTASAQLFLIFEIAAHSSISRPKSNTSAYEVQWRRALSASPSTPSIASIQCHILAQLSYLLKGDHPHLLRHRAHAVSMCHQLGLHQGHKSHSLPPFEAETRKKVFWCQYVLDKFASATTGTPMLLRDADITVEYPADIDDENISTQGISPALPGELTKISSAIALFQGSRILSKTLEHLYPARSSYQLSLSKLHSLSDELDQWQEELPDHLRLRFCNDKPATNLISCRSPLLSLAYFYTRSLIHRPLLCYGSGSAVSAATIVLAAASKHILQILDLLRERCMNYTFPLSVQDVLMNAGFSILWQCLDLEEDSKLIKDNHKSLASMMNKLKQGYPLACQEFYTIARSFISTDVPRIEDVKTTDNESSRVRSGDITTKQKATRKQMQLLASRLSSSNLQSELNGVPRRSTAPNETPTKRQSPHSRSNSAIGLVNTNSTSSMPFYQATSNSLSRTESLEHNSSVINLDYFPLGDAPNGSNAWSSSMQPPKRHSMVTESANNPSWDRLAYGSNTADAYNTISPDALNRTISNTETFDWTSDAWQMIDLDLSPKTNVPQSLLSFSEESMASGDDFVFSASGSHNGSTSTNEGLELTTDEAFKGIAMPVSTGEDDIDFQHEISA